MDNIHQAAKIGDEAAIRQIVEKRNNEVFALDEVIIL